MAVIKSYEEVLTLGQEFFNTYIALGKQCKAITSAAIPYIRAKNPLYTVMEKVASDLGQDIDEDLIAATVLQVAHQINCDAYQVTSDFRVYFNRPVVKDRRVYITKDIFVTVMKEVPGTILSGYLYMTRSKKLAIYFEYKLPQSADNLRFVCAIDVDMHPFLLDSDGSAFSNTENFISAVKRIGDWEQTLSRKTPGSNSYINCANQLRDLKNSAHQIRLDAFHKLANAYVKTGDLLVVAEKSRPDLMDFSLERSMYCSNLFIRILERQAKTMGVPFYRVPVNQIYSAIAAEARIPVVQASEYSKRFPLAYLGAMFSIGQQLLLSLKEKDNETAPSDKTSQFSELE